MLSASLNFPLASPAIQHAVTDDRRRPLANPQSSSFENLNLVRYPEDSCPSAPSQVTSIVRPKIGYDKSDFVELKMYESQFDHKLTERRFGLQILYPRALASRSTDEIMFLAGFGLAASVTTHAAWLEASLNELGECSAYALDENLEEPSELGLMKAKKLLETVSTWITNQPDIYPMDEGSIAIDFRNPENKSGVLFLVEQDGSGALFHRTKNSKGRLRVDDAADLLQEVGLLELKRVGIL